jgi:restriction endonuclease Mrr
MLSPQTLDLQFQTIDKELFKHLGNHPEILYKLAPRKFEEIIATILKDMGCEIELTPETRDGGRDILAVFPSPFGKLMTIVECKRYAPHRKIGIEIVERFLWVLDRRDNASCGLIATTTYFSSEAKALENEFKFKLKLRDFAQIKEWIANFGKWTEAKNSGLWLPSALIDSK